MDREKQIEEMARDICGLGRDCHGCTFSMSYVCKAKKYAERAVDKGYCKQSEVARKIIGEILLNHTPDVDGFFTMHESELVKIKKKYTE